MNNYSSLLKKIKDKKAKIGIIGLGYVGLPLAILFADNGFQATGFVRKSKKINDLNNGKSNLGGVDIDNDLKRVISEGKLSIKMTEGNALQDQEVLIVCVPTPMTEKKQPDLTDLKEVARVLSLLNLSNRLIINESTVAPFMTREVFGRLGGNYFLVCSPERVDPGNKTKTTKDIPKIIGGKDKESSILAKTLYSNIVKQSIIVSSIEVAEMTKMLENSYRAVNIALINDFAKLAGKCNIDILEVISAASTKWSFHAHYPSIGVGGHCVPKDPYYLLHLARKHKTPMKTLEYSLLTNEGMPEYLLSKLLKIYKKGMRILVYGITYKKNINDLRGSPAIIFCRLLKEKGIDFGVYDPFITMEDVGKMGFKYSPLEKVDVLVVGADHSSLEKDYLKTVDENTVIIDGRNYFKSKKGKSVLGVGRKLI